MNRIENPEVDSHKYAKLIFEKCAKKKKFNGGGIAFSTNGAIPIEYT